MNSTQFHTLRDVLEWLILEHWNKPRAMRRITGDEREAYIRNVEDCLGPAADPWPDPLEVAGEEPPSIAAAKDWLNQPDMPRLDELIARFHNMPNGGAGIPKEYQTDAQRNSFIRAIVVAEPELATVFAPTNKPKPATAGEVKPDERRSAPMSRVKLPTLQKHDREAWQLSLVNGMTQAKVAAQLNQQHGTSYTQPLVSRMIGRAKAHADASGLSDKLPKPAERERAVDPARLDIGARIDKRTPRPSDLSRADS